MKQNMTKKRFKKKGGTKEKQTPNKTIKHRKGRLETQKNKESVIDLIKEHNIKASSGSIFRALSQNNKAEFNDVRELTRDQIIKIYYKWLEVERNRLRENRLKKKEEPDIDNKITKRRKTTIKKTNQNSNDIILNNLEVAEAAETAAEEQKKIDDMNTYGTLYYPTPRSPTRTMVIDDYPPGFTPHGHTKKRKSNTAPIMTSPRGLFVNQEISEEPYDIDSLFNSSDMPSPLINDSDI
jgi:hypothetical protein